MSSFPGLLAEAMTASKVKPVRCERLHALLLSLVLFGLLVVPGASAAARLISPLPGAVTNSHPVFTWELGPGDSSDALYVARGPETTPQGAFFHENVERSVLFFDGTLPEWSPEPGLFAGSYWWNVRTYDRDRRLAYSATSSFTVAPVLRLLGIRVTHVRFIGEHFIGKLYVDLRWVTNIRRVRLEARLLRGRRLVGRDVWDLETGSKRRSSPALSDEVVFQWSRPRSMRAGTRLRLIVSVSGSGMTATLTRQVRAP